MRSLLVAPLCAIFVASASALPAEQAVGPTVRDIVEFKQIIQPANQQDDALTEQVSPDGKSAFVVTRQAELGSDANRYEILLLDMSPGRLAAQRTHVPEVILSITPEHDNRPFPMSVQDVQWHGDDTLVFLARLKGDLFQVYSLDVQTRKLVQLTNETNPIQSYAASLDLRRVVYSVQVPNPPLKPGQHAVVVGRQSFWGVKFGQQDMRSQDPVFQYFVSDGARSRPRPLGAAFTAGARAWPVVSISPDGRWALLPRWEPDRVVEWARDYPRVAEVSKIYSSSQRVDPLGYFSAPNTYTPRRMVAWHLEDAKAQPTLDAPDDALPGSSQYRSDRLWQGTGDSVVLAGTHLPLTPGNQDSTASHVVEYWPQSGRWISIATLHTELNGAYALPGGFALVDGETRREFHRDAGGAWRESSGATAEAGTPRSAWALHVVQGVNEPPDVYAVGPAGERRRLTMLNPQFKADSWGSMQPYSWKDAKGRDWAGGLLTGASMDPHARYPLLIQTYGFSPDRFFLDGPNKFDGATSAFAGRAFLREGILVLQLPLRPTGTTFSTEGAAQQAFNDAVRSAVDALAREGRIDPTRVGIIGWSATGQRVLNLVTFDDLPIRAATLADGDASTLFAMTVIYGRSDSMLQLMSDSNDGLPFGQTLPSWVRNDPALHTDCIRAATRIETYGPWVLNNWDIYGLLRVQYKPVEMIVMPEGEHALSMPSDRMASLQGNVDWYAFWLADKERAAPLLSTETTESVAAQYANWRQMATMKIADDARPRCAR